LSPPRERLQTEVDAGKSPGQPLVKTQSVVSGLLDRLNLLLQVTIAPEHVRPPPVSSVSDVLHTAAKAGSWIICCLPEFIYLFRNICKAPYIRVKQYTKVLSI